MSWDSAPKYLSFAISYLLQITCKRFVIKIYSTGDLVKISLDLADYKLSYLKNAMFVLYLLSGVNACIPGVSSIGVFLTAHTWLSTVSKRGIPGGPPRVCTGVAVISLVALQTLTVRILGVHINLWRICGMNQTITC